ncbi:hypothetical protein ANCCEY_03822 [Ancylostoma ceylanicum]|uniref:Uncharacterized protein n=1 Tax=Ancylostoma ceylanicum TaxID=53326 RepID=A0A0D6M412_9BILA|nr:hypothetical protein ANCCEY_03822 [Ancylostoma ceylanicum]
MLTPVMEKVWESTIFHLTEETTSTERSVQKRSTKSSLTSTTWMESFGPSTDGHTTREATLKTTESSLTPTESSSKLSNIAAASSILPSTVTSRDVVGTTKTSSTSVEFHKSTNEAARTQTISFTLLDMSSSPQNAQRNLSVGATISASTLPNVSNITPRSEHSAEPQDDVTSPADHPLTSATAQAPFEARTPGSSATSQRDNSQLPLKTSWTPNSLLYSTAVVISSTTIPEVTVTTIASQKYTSTHHNYQASTEMIVPTRRSTPLSIENSEETTSRELLTSTDFTPPLSTLPLSTKLITITATKLNEFFNSETKRSTADLSRYDTVDTFSSRQWPTSNLIGEQPWFTPNSTEKYSSTLTLSEGYSWRSDPTLSAHWQRSRSSSLTTLDPSFSTSQPIPEQMSSSIRGSSSTTMKLYSKQEIHSTKEHEMYPALDSSLMTPEIYLSTLAQSDNEQLSTGTISHVNGGKINTAVTQSITDQMDTITTISVITSMKPKSAVKPSRFTTIVTMMNGISGQDCEIQAKRRYWFVDLSSAS